VGDDTLGRERRTLSNRNPRKSIKRRNHNRSYTHILEREIKWIIEHKFKVMDKNLECVHFSITHLPNCT